MAVVLATLASTLVASPSSAFPEAPLTLEECIAIATESNPRLLANGEWQNAARARVQQARSLPQPTLDYDSDLQERVLGVDDPGETYLGVTQTLELPGRRALRVGVAREEEAASGQERRSVQLDVVFEVKEAFFGLLHAEQQLRSVEQDVELSRRFAEMSRLGFEAGDLARVEVVRAELEAAGAERGLRAARNQVDMARARLNVLLDREPAAPLEVRGELRQDVRSLPEESALLVQAQAALPEIAVLQAAVRREELREKQARLAPYPDLELGVSRHRVRGEGSWWDVTVSVPIPLFWNEFAGRRAEARASQAALRHALDNARRSVALEIGDARRSAESARQQIEAYEETLLPGAEEVYAMFAFSYQAGEIGGIELVAARSRLLEVRQAYADALYAHAVATAALERAVGGPLEGVVP